MFYCFVTIGGRAGGAAAPPKLGLLRFLEKQEKFGQSKFLKKFACCCCCFFLLKIDIFYFKDGAY